MLHNTAVSDQVTIKNERSANKMHTFSFFLRLGLVKCYTMTTMTTMTMMTMMTAMMMETMRC